MDILHFRKKMLITICICCLLSGSSHAQDLLGDSNTLTSSKRLNFYIFTKEAGTKIDFLGSTTLWRIRIKSLFRKKKLYVIVAGNTAQVVDKMKSKLQKRQALIGNVWIDSHGLYKQGYSSFHIGTDEYSYKNIGDTTHTSALRELKAWCDASTVIGLGSCYGGATFSFPGSDSVPARRMNGDSLVIGLGNIFQRVTVYGSESWVMMKPGMFSNNFGFAGYPLGKRYRSKYWQPVWERLGQWNSYNSSTGIFKAVNTVAMDKRGDIKIRNRNYQELSKGKKAVGKNLTKIGQSI